MIIVDTALAKRHAENNPVRVALIGAGFMGRAAALQIAQSVPGMKVVAIYNRTLEKAKKAYQEAGIEEFEVVSSQTVLEDRISRGKYSVTEDPFLLARAGNIDVLLEVTGAVEFSAKVVFEAIQHKKHVVLMNAELDGTIGAILKVHADKAGVIITNVDGDQPGVEMNLYRYVKTIGLKPVLCGNIKGLQDHYRNPTTQQSYAKQWAQNAHMVTSFADGTKISFEQAVVANATGMTIGQRGMYGPTVPAGTPLQDIIDKYPMEALTSGPGIVDYVVGASPPAGIFILATHDDPRQRHFLKLYKVGDGPLYLFYTPYHNCHFEVPITCARAALFHDAAITPIGGPAVEVVATAKMNLKAGETIDGIGGYHSYGQCETADVTAAQMLLPMGLAEGCILKRDIPMDQVITYADVTLPEGRFSDKLRQEQNEYFKVTV
ncbi:MAG: Gfo/Idh/MocA family oxidoreductase [Cyclobacteriaceae bacterium]|nr:Gfo/Idh/MocA family oxidoreductase [Cyclobacteriaceae bacterium]MDH4295083.1 Gfo/Idh/MocA family oxidoreductase [Cyclobacteriaceae bacterium]